MSPGVSIVRALEKVLEPKSAVGNLIARMHIPIKKVRATAELAGTKLEGEIELGERGAKKVMTEIALQIDALVETLCNKAPLLLLID